MPREFKVVEYSKDYIVIIKPYGYLSEESDSEPNAHSAIRDFLTSNGARFEKIHTVHRLDRTTEGLMVYALNKKTAAEISHCIADGKFEKIYEAHITRSPELPESGEMRDLLFFDRHRDKSFVVEKKRNGAKEALLEYEIVREYRDEDGEDVSVARVKLGTGRTHQIRVQFASRKSPLVGDRKYGSRIARRGPSLFSVKLGFEIGGERREYEMGE